MTSSCNRLKVKINDMKNRVVPQAVKTELLDSLNNPVSPLYCHCESNAAIQICVIANGVKQSHQKKCIFPKEIATVRLQ